MEYSDLLTISVVFAPYSLMAFGGGLSILSGIQNEAVHTHGWITSEEFITLFAISRAAPGPGTMVITLVGWEVAGLLGALVATLAIFLPTAFLCIGVAAFQQKFRGRNWLINLETAIAPVGAGLLLAGVASVAQLVSTGFALMVISAVSSAICLLRPATHPLLIIAAGAAMNLSVMLITQT